MEDVLIANIYYLLLVAGVLLAIMAMFTPGTGLLEAGAVVALLLAGWGIYREPVNLWALFVLFVGVFPFLLAVRRSGRLIFLAVAIVAFVIGSAYLFRSDAWWKPAVHPVLALVVSILAGGYLWLATRKVLEAGSALPTHDLRAVIGATGEAKTAVHNEGSVQVNGELWSAHSEIPIPAGAPVRVLRREGFILEVEQVLKPET
jgi:membrane-bound serine protease (ClpP class)